MKKKKEKKQYLPINFHVYENIRREKIHNQMIMLILYFSFLDGIRKGTEMLYPRLSGAACSASFLPSLESRSPSRLSPTGEDFLPGL